MLFAHQVICFFPRVLLMFAYVEQELRMGSSILHKVNCGLCSCGQNGRIDGGKWNARHSEMGTKQVPGTGRCVVNCN